MAQIVLERRFELQRHARVEDAHADFLVQGERARIEVRRADVRPNFVDYDDLLVQQRRLELVEPYAGLEQRGVETAPRAPHERAVRMLARQHQETFTPRFTIMANSSTTPSFGAKYGFWISTSRRALAIATVYSIATDDTASADALLTTCAHTSPDGLEESGKHVVARRQAVRLFDPVLRENGLEAMDDGPFQAHAGVAPVLGVCAVAEPLVGDPVAEGVADLAVDDEQLAVRAVIEAAEVPPMRLAVGRELHAVALEPLQLLRVRASSRRGSRSGLGP